MIDINQTPDLVFSEDEEYLNKPLDYTINTCSLPKKDLRELEYSSKEYIYLYTALFVYQIPFINNSSSDDILVKFITTFKHLNPSKELKHLKTFIQHSVNEDMLNKLCKLYTTTSFNKKNLFTQKRYVIFNNKNIILNNNYTNRDRKAFENYKKALLGKAILERNLYQFNKAYKYSDKSLTGIKKQYKLMGRNIKTSTIMKYVEAMKIELVDNSRTEVDYNYYLKNFITFNPDRKITYDILLKHINKTNNYKICIKTLNNHITEEMKQIIKQHNKSIKSVKVKNHIELISEYYNEYLKNAFIIRFDELLSIQHHILLETGKETKLEAIKYNIKAINSKAKFERSIYNFSAMKKFMEE